MSRYRLWPLPSGGAQSGETKVKFTLAAGALNLSPGFKTPTHTFLFFYLCVCLTPWILAHQVTLSMGFPRQEYWSELPFPSPVNLPNPGIKPKSPTLYVDSLLLSYQGSPPVMGQVEMDGMQWEENVVTSLLPKNQNLIRRKPWINPDRSILQNNWPPRIFKIIKIMKVQESLRNFLDATETKCSM